MRRSILLTTLLALTSPDLLAQSKKYDVDATAAFSFSTIAQVQEAPSISTLPGGLFGNAYQDAYDASVKNRSPMVVFVGLGPAYKVVGDHVEFNTRTVKGAPPKTSYCSVDSRNGYPEKCIIVALPDGKGGLYTKGSLTLDSTATDAEIVAAIRREGVGPAPTPFRKPSALPDDRREGDSSSPWLPEAEQRRLRLLWPKDLPFPKGLKFYRPTRHSQETSILDDQKHFQALHIASGPDDPNLQTKYSAPGGLAELPQERWNSYLGVVLGGRIQVFEEDFPFRPGVYDGKARAGADSPGFLMRKRSAEFGGGIAFYDLLTNQGDEAFEVRASEFDEDGHQMFVMHKNVSLRPQGYSGLSQSCLSCHNEAGSQRYGAGIRGWNGPRGRVFSLPLFREGTVDWDTENFPIDLVSPKMGPGPTMEAEYPGQAGLDNSRFFGTFGVGARARRGRR